MFNTWERGDTIYVSQSNDSCNKSIKLTYEQRNKLRSDNNPNIYFNETLFPKYFIGQVLYLDDNKSHIMQPYEIIKIEKCNVT